MGDLLDGISILKRKRLGNGGDSFVIPFPICRPFNIVHHGTNKFEYGQYGIHIGQEDRLTFLSKYSDPVRAKFLDCRKNSKSFGKRMELEIQCDGSETLIIPPGIAHTFDDLANITTLNTYRVYLPPPEDWITGSTDWDLASDIINVPLDVDPNELRPVVANSRIASNKFYQILSDRQKKNKEDLGLFGHALTEDVHFSDGTSFRVRFREPVQPKHKELPVESKIAGVEWKELPILQTGPESGIVPFPDLRPVYIVDHGDKIYEHDAFGVHLGQEDNLVFCGRESANIELTLRDIRANSETLGLTEKIHFGPSVTRKLIIPPGVCHAFKFDPGVFTLNQPKIFLGKLEYDPTVDVIDLDLYRDSYPSLEPNQRAASQEYYQAFSEAQKKFLEEGDQSITPAVVLAKDEGGELYRVAIRPDPAAEAVFEV